MNSSKQYNVKFYTENSIQEYIVKTVNPIIAIALAKLLHPDMKKVTEILATNEFKQ